MKKKILFCLQTMVMGGVEKELITVLKKMNADQFEIELLLFYTQDAEVMKAIPKYVKVTVLNLDRSYWVCSGLRYVESRLKKGHFLQAAQIAAKTVKNGGGSSAYVDLSELPALQRQYDCAICYHLHSSMVLRYVAEKVSSKKKIAWIHNDFEISGYKIACYERDLREYDTFVAVSDQLRKEFVQRCPSYGERTVTIHNIVDEQEIIRKSMEMADSHFQSDRKIKLVTVGRYVEQKGYDLAISACRILKEKGLNISWYAIGWGSEEEKLRALVEREQLQDSFYLVGRKANPYPYIAGADIYVQPSRHEGYAITLEEARVLKKVIVCTNFAGASEQIESGVDGIVVRSFSPDVIAEAIGLLCADKDYREMLQRKSGLNVYSDSWEKILNVLS